MSVDYQDVLERNFCLTILKEFVLALVTYINMFHQEK